jgi:hypothetical protein
MRDAKTLNPAQIIMARDWLIDCCQTEACIEYIHDCNNFEIELLVEKQFDGGLVGFLNTCGELK